MEALISQCCMIRMVEEWISIALLILAIRLSLMERISLGIRYHIIAVAMSAKKHVPP